MIAALRGSLETAQRDGDREGGPRFQVKEIEVEATVQATRDRQVAGGVRFSVVNAKGQAAKSDGVVQRVLLRLGVNQDYLISRSHLPGAGHALP
ncbi:hypothetical protein DI272_15580 [Streptomyces sp. Act143]|nr:hypothetical protein DI272_15580 [Streptomyces sp. Act143]